MLNDANEDYMLRCLYQRQDQNVFRLEGATVHRKRSHSSLRSFNIRPTHMEYLARQINKSAMQLNPDSPSSYASRLSISSISCHPLL